jgi:dihydrolipoamide dehydrogenase
LVQAPSCKNSRLSTQLKGGVTQLLKKNKVTVFDGHGQLLGKQKLVVSKDGKPVTELTANHIILATGARPSTPAGLEPDGKLIWTYKDAMVPSSMPKSLLIVGSGAIGIEFASFYRTLGADVTVVEAMDQVLPVEDKEISAFARKSFEKQGMKIITSATVQRLKKNADSVTATIHAGSEVSEVTAERVILAVGITANSEGIGLEETAVRLEKGHVVTDEWLSTDEPGLYAIGDLVAPPWLAHKASHEGVVCVEKIAGFDDVLPLDVQTIPGCTYCHPQIASIGLNEYKALEMGYDVKVGRFPFIGNGKAIAMGETEGKMKTVFDAETGTLLGAHLIGAEVTELIQGFGIAKTMESTEAELLHTVFPHPSLSEMMQESVLDAFGRAIHF